MVIDTSLIKSLETSLGLYKAEYPIRLVDMQLSYPNHDITGDEDQYTLIIDSEIINKGLIHDYQHNTPLSLAFSFLHTSKLPSDSSDGNDIYSPLKHCNSDILAGLARKS